MLFKKRTITYEQVPVGSLLVAVLALAVWAIPSARHVEDELARRIEFNVREGLGKSPTLDERIKIFAYDDAAAAAEYSQESISLQDWALTIKSIAANKPERIVFDKIFTFPGHDDAENAFFTKTVTETGVNVFAAMFSVQHDIAGRPTLAREKTCYSSGDAVPWKNLVSSNWRFFGPDKQLERAFTDIGHIQISEQSRYPLGFFKNNGQCVPFLAAVATQNYRFEGNGIIIGNQRITPDANGEMQPNLTRRENYYKRTFSLKPVFALARANAPVPVVKPGDTVIVLPAMYTGNTDFKRTPLGNIEGGFFHVANMNSFLTGQWLSSVGYGAAAPLLVFLAALLSAIFCKLLSSGKAIVVTTGTALLVTTVALSLFIQKGLMLFWLLPVVTLLLATGTELVLQSIAVERRAAKVRAALEGLVPRHVLKTLQKNHNSLEFKPQKIHVSIMFLDVEGFSVHFEGVDPNIVFTNLQKQLSRLGSIVHEHGGIIDKTLGDGLLAFFGHSYDPSLSSTQESHALQALKCAAAIQKEWALRMARNPETSQPLSLSTDILPLPLRIGINSGEVFLGNLGSGDRVDITIVGDAVNFAKRLEDSANAFRIMVGPATMKAIEKNNSEKLLKVKNISFRKVLLQIKHHSELFEAWEGEPFHNETTLLREALANARGQKHRKHARIPWRFQEPMEVLINGTIQGRLVDFSDTGFCIETKEYFARKVQASIELACNIPSLQAELRSNDVGTLLAEVRWGAPSEQNTKHGFRILNLNSEQRERLHKILFSKANIESTPPESLT
jgi:class 3 adenylate cyclase